MAQDAGLGGRLGVEPRGDHLALRPASGLVRDGRLSAGVLLWLADWEACREAVAGDGTIIVATRELRLRVLQPVEVDDTTVIVARAAPLRRSSRNSVIEVRIHREADEAALGYAVGSYVARRGTGSPRQPPDHHDRPDGAGAPPADRGAAGAAPRCGSCAGPRRLGADLGRSGAANPQGGLSGPVVGLAAEAAIEAASGPGVGVQDLSVAFLAAGRTGPFVAHAELLGGGTYRAELRDEGPTSSWLRPWV